MLRAVPTSTSAEKLRALEKETEGLWSVRALRSRIDSMLYERTALSKKPAQLIKQELTALREEDRLTPDLVFRASPSISLSYHPGRFWSSGSTMR